ncbi:Mth938-like domain-containing protein [Brackiella oedipodis]|uniref:Mth938-like domain-containing protein n=1 Tax=Brackiella oedipodis TaxID=124225 RepID=UPI00048D6212|nr:Mth938-like domain-containing protein [Brackiella oedipodis]
MLLQQQENKFANTVTSYTLDYVEINKERYPHSVFFKPEGPIQAWPVKHVRDIDYDALLLASGATAKKASAFDFLDSPEGASATTFENAPELLIIGTGTEQHFLDPSVLQPFIKARIGIESMDSNAAARTYNVLMSEGRNVAVAILI